MANKRDDQFGLLSHVCPSHNVLTGKLYSESSLHQWHQHTLEITWHHSHRYYDIKLRFLRMCPQ